MLAFFPHDCIGPREEDSEAVKGHVDNGLPFEVFGVFIGDVTNDFRRFILEMPISEVANLILMVPGSMRVSHSGGSG